jgi:hypothetical protein
MNSTDEYSQQAGDSAIAQRARPELAFLILYILNTISRQSASRFKHTRKIVVLSFHDIISILLYKYKSRPMIHFSVSTTRIKKGSAQYAQD